VLWDIMERFLEKLAGTVARVFPRADPILWCGIRPKEKL
jgi:hypothetical protein